MLSKKMLLIGAIGATTASAGTMIGLYAHEVSKRDQRIQDKYLKVIYDNLNHIRNISGLSEMSDDFDTFKDEIVKHVAEKDSDLKTETILQFEATLTEAQANINDQILTGDENHDILSKEVTRMNDEITKALETIKGGIVGDHDINYYKTVIENSISKTQFQSLVSDVDGLDTNIQILIDDIKQNKEDASQNSIDITAAITRLDNMARIIGEESNTASDTTLFGKIKALETAAVGTNLHLHNIDNTLTEFKDNLVGNTQGIDNLKNDLAIVKTNTDLNTLTISKLETAIQLGTEHTQKHDALIADLEKEISELTQGLALTNTTHATEIAAVQTELDKLKAEDKLIKADLSKILNTVQSLIIRVTQNETDIKDLQVKFANLTPNVNAKLDDLKKYFDTTLATHEANHKVDHAKLELLITANADSVAKIETDLTAIKDEQAALKSKLIKLDTQLIAYGKGLDEVKKSIAEALNAVDDLSKEVKKNTAAILGLDARVQALENASNSTSGAELLYQAKDSVTREGSIDMYFTPFFSPKPLENYRRLEMMGYSELSGRYFALDFNLDTQPKSQNRIHDYAFWLGLHPNRTWLQYNVDYITDKITCSFAYAAGNASWTWNWAPNRYRILQIYGIKK